MGRKQTREISKLKGITSETPTGSYGSLYIGSRVQHILWRSRRTRGNPVSEDFHGLAQKGIDPNPIKTQIEKRESGRAEVLSSTCKARPLLGHPLEDRQRLLRNRGQKKETTNKKKDQFPLQLIRDLTAVIYLMGWQSSQEAAS